MHTRATTPYKPTDEELADIEDALAEAERGEFATDAEVAAMYKRHGLRKHRRVGKGAGQMRMLGRLHSTAPCPRVTH